MTTPSAPALSRTHRLSLWRMGLCLLSLHPLLIAASKNDWPVIPADELAATASSLDPEAPAEILYRKIEIDQSGLPYDTSESEYIRYKIYAPEKSDAYTRISQLATNFDASSRYENLSISARLTLPDGTVKLFGNKDIKDRPYARSGTDARFASSFLGGDTYAKEKLLAVGGVLPGSILEYRITKEKGTTAGLVIVFDGNRSRAFSLQNRTLPTRKIEFVGKAPADKRYAYQCFTLNRSIGQSTQEMDRKKGIITIAATNVPPNSFEPLSGPTPSYSLTVLECISDTETKRLSRSGGGISARAEIKTDGPWSPIACNAYVVFEDCSEVSGEIKKLAAKLTANASTPLAKAEAIHAYAQKSYQEVHRRPASAPGSYIKFVRSIDHILDTIAKPTDYKVSSTDFLHLANALYKAAGFPTRGLRLPDRAYFPFGPQLVAATALPHWAVQVKIDDKWLCSMPHFTPVVPFGILPWRCEGQLALVAKEGPQELIEIPNTKSAGSKITNTATLSLAENGALEGSAKRRYTGHHAYTLRSHLAKKKTPQAIRVALEDIIISELINRTTANKEDEEDVADAPREDSGSTEKSFVRVTDIKGFDDAGSPIEITYSLRLAGYATVTSGRMILRTSVYRTKEKNPFTSEARHNAVRFPFAWQEIDNITLKLPAGYAPASTVLPESSANSVLYHRHKLTHDPAAQTIVYRREFFCEATFLPSEQYSALKAFFEIVDHADNHEIILNQTTPPATPTAQASL